MPAQASKIKNSGITQVDIQKRNEGELLISLYPRNSNSTRKVNNIIKIKPRAGGITFSGTIKSSRTRDIKEMNRVANNKKMNCKMLVPFLNKKVIPNQQISKMQGIKAES